MSCVVHAGIAVLLKKAKFPAYLAKCAENEYLAKDCLATAFAC